MRMRRIITAGIATALAVSLANAVEKPARFWNLTLSTVTSLRLSKAATSTFGPNLAANDPDGAVDPDERLPLPGVAPGAYDIELTFKDGRSCLARNVSIVSGKPFSVEEKALVDCRKR